MVMSMKIFPTDALNIVLIINIIVMYMGQMIILVWIIIQ